MYGGSSTSGGTCQIWYAIPQEWWVRSSLRPCTHRWWLGRPLWRWVTGCCGGPSIRTSWLNTCSQRQGDAKSVRASGQAPGAPCTMCIFWWSWDSLWLAAHRTSRAASAWSSWRMCGPRFGAPPEVGRRCQTAVACQSMVSHRRWCNLQRQARNMMFPLYIIIHGELPHMEPQLIFFVFKLCILNIKPQAFSEKIATKCHVRKVIQISLV